MNRLAAVSFVRALVMRPVVGVAIPLLCVGPVLAQGVTVNAPAAAPAAATRPATVVAATRPAVVGSGTIQAEKVEHDFGPFWIGPKLTYAFNITNKGTTDLEIRKVLTTCGCTTAGEYPKLLKPTQSGTFPFTLATAGLYGTFEKSITIESSDPVTPKLKLVLKGNAQPRVELEPRTISFGSIFGSEAINRVVAIRNKTDQPLKLAMDPFASTGPFKCELVEKTPGQVYELAVTAEPSKVTKIGPFNTTILLMTNVAEQRQIEVMASGALRDRVEMEPAQLALSPFVPQPYATTQPASQTYTRDLRLKNFGATPVTITAVTVNDPALKASFREEQRGRSYVVQVSIPRDYVVPAEGRLLTVNTDDAEKATLVVPIRKYVPSMPSGTTPRPSPANQMLGRTMPGFQFPTLTGRTVSSQDLQGSVVVLDFFAPNCGFCAKQLPVLETVRPDYESKGVRFVYVSQTMGKKEFTAQEIAAKLQQLGVKSEAVVDTGNAYGRSLGVSGYPTMFIVGKDGKIAAAQTGFRDDLAAYTKTQLDTLLGNKATPAAVSMGR